MEDIFHDFDFVIVYINDLLVFSRDIQRHKKHLESFYQFVFKHALVLSPTQNKFIISQTKNEYIGLYISQGKIQLQPHVLQSLLRFPDQLPDIKSVQRFLGYSNYIQQLYPKQAKDTRILQQRLKKVLVWLPQMTEAI